MRLVVIGATGRTGGEIVAEATERGHDVVGVARSAGEVGDVPVHPARELPGLLAGADGLLLISPYYNRPEPDGTERHFRTIADAVDLPQIIYNVPGRTGRNIAVESAVALAEHENIVGYKAASGDLGRTNEVVERTRDENFGVLSGDDALTLPVVAQGGTGCISVAANVEPDRVVALVGSALAGDFERARELQYELGDLFRVLFAESNPMPVNEAMEMRGVHSATMRSPLCPLQPETRERLRAVLDDLERE